MGCSYKRREMVSGADAAALAAAKTCSVPVANDPTIPEAQADTAAMANVGGLTTPTCSISTTPGIAPFDARARAGTSRCNIRTHSSCSSRGIFGASTRTVTTAATAAWGSARRRQRGSDRAGSSLSSSPSGRPGSLIAVQECNFWYNNGDAAIGMRPGDSSTSIEWDVADSRQNCNSAGRCERAAATSCNNFGSAPSRSPNRARHTSAACTGHATDNWQDLNDQDGCAALLCVPRVPVPWAHPLDAGERLRPTGQQERHRSFHAEQATPDKFAIIGFTTLELSGTSTRATIPWPSARPEQPGTGSRPGRCSGLDGVRVSLASHVAADNDCGAPAVRRRFDCPPVYLVS